MFGHLRLTWPVAILLLAFINTGHVAAQSPDFKSIEAKELAKNPQRYWATGIVFTDTLKSLPSGGEVRMNDRTYIKFTTKVAGDCWMEAEAAAGLTDSAVDSSFAFTGTVLEQGRSFFSRVPRYRILVNQLTKTVTSVENIPETLTVLRSATTNLVDSRALENMEILFAGVQSDIQAYAHGRGLELWQMFEEGSTNRLQSETVVRAAVQSMADQLQLAPVDLFSEFVTAVLAAKNPQPAPSPIVAEEGSPEAEPLPVVEESRPEVESAEVVEKPKPVKKAKKTKKAKKPAADEDKPVNSLPRAVLAPVVEEAPAEEPPPVEEPAPAPVEEAAPAVEEEPPVVETVPDEMLVQPEAAEVVQSPAEEEVILEQVEATIPEIVEEPPSPEETPDPAAIVEEDSTADVIVTKESPPVQVIVEEPVAESTNVETAPVVTPDVETTDDANAPIPLR